MVITGMIAVFLLGILVGGLVSSWLFKPKHCGTLRIDTSDSDGPYLFLELEQRVESVLKEDYVIFKVNVKDYVSHK